MRAVELLCITFALSAPAFAQTPSAPDTLPPPQQITSAASEYLNHALDLMQQNALHRTEINWPEIRQSAFEHAAGAQTTFDTYPAIYYALSQLDERHSFLMLPDSLTPEQKSTVRAAIRKVMLPLMPQYQSKRPPSPFSHRSDPDGHLIHSGALTFAWVSIPPCGGKHTNMAENRPDFQGYAMKLHGIAAELNSANPDGWIIDLRGNGGGNMWPMLVGIGFVLGEGTVGEFVTADSRVPWSYKQGHAYSGNHDMNGFTIDPPLSLPKFPKVAVLIDSGTTSSGEAVAIAFQGRPNTRTFGSHTYGLTSANHLYKLSDGANLLLANSVEADRNHHVYLEGVEPEVAFPEPSTLPDQSSDDVLQAAMQWLSSATPAPTAP